MFANAQCWGLEDVQDIVQPVAFVCALQWKEARKAAWMPRIAEPKGLVVAAHTKGSEPADAYGGCVTIVVGRDEVAVEKRAFSLSSLLGGGGGGKGRGKRQRRKQCLVRDVVVGRLVGI